MRCCVFHFHQQHLPSLITQQGQKSASCSSHNLEIQLENVRSRSARNVTSWFARVSISQRLTPAMIAFAAPVPDQGSILLSITNTTGTTQFHLAGEDIHIHPGSSEGVTHNSLREQGR